MSASPYVCSVEKDLINKRNDELQSGQELITDREVYNSINNAVDEILDKWLNKCCVRFSAGRRHSIAASVRSERDPGGRRGHPAVRRRHGTRASLFGQMVQRRRNRIGRILPLRTTRNAASHRLQFARHQRQRKFLFFIRKFHRF